MFELVTFRFPEKKKHAYIFKTNYGALEQYEMAALLITLEKIIEIS